MAVWLSKFGGDAVHTLDLPNGNQTTDAEINAIAEVEQRVVVTKDDEFVDSHLLLGRPPKLLWVATGNVSNRQLEALMVPLLGDINREFQTNSFIELGQTGLIVRG